MCKLTAERIYNKIWNHLETCSFIKLFFQVPRTKLITLAYFYLVKDPFSIRQHYCKSVTIYDFCRILQEIELFNILKKILSPVNFEWIYKKENTEA